MIELALKAEIPLISVRTTDTINLLDVIGHLVPGKSVRFVEGKLDKQKIPISEDYIVIGGLEHEPEWLYRWATDTNKVVILVNPSMDEESPVIFDGGVLPTPPEMVRTLLKEVLEDHAIETVMHTLGGLTLKDIGEVGRMAMTLTGELTPRSVMTIRRMYANKLHGIESVDPYEEFYIPDPKLITWADLNESFFLEPEDRRLQPRGVLLDGPPGTGKTQGAKFLAREWGVPLYRLDISGLMNKWQGESEGRLKAGLHQMEAEAPCIFLIDEVEKLFQSESDDTGTILRMLSYLLWWMEEHKSQVLTVMTTNDAHALPDELVRPGRLDEQIKLLGLEKDAAEKFCFALWGTFKISLDFYHSEMKPILKKLYHKNIDQHSTPIHSQALLTQKVYEVIKHLTN